MQLSNKFKPILGGFVPLAALWDEEAPSLLFPSEASARWFVRAQRSALVEEKAIAMHAGRLMIHVERFEVVAQRVALEGARREAR